MRVLFTSWPAHGHLLPMLPMVRAAERGGHDVVVASGAEGVAEARRRGLSTWDVGPSRSESDATFRRAVPDLGALAPEHRIPAVIGGTFGTAAFERAERLVPRAIDWQPDVVVHTISELAGAVAAVRTGARHLVHGLGPLPAEAWAWFGSRVDELGRVWDISDLDAALLDAPYLDTCPPSLQRDAVAAFEHRVPLQPSAGEVLPGEHLPWDDATLRALPFEHTVHLTLGTIFFGATHVFETVLAGLGELSVNVLVALGPGADPTSLGPQPAHVLVTDFAPHAALLPRCDALVTQGGAGTILAALCHGLPHLILPQGADQFVNAATAERAGLALQLPPSELTPAAVSEMVGRLLDDGAIAQRTRLARAEIEAMPDADAVLDALTFVRSEAR